MTGEYFETPFVKLHYYKFGTGPKHMLCFHGLGMHGRQFAILEPALGNRYTFWGFDLLFHEGTKLTDTRLPTIKAGIKKHQLNNLIQDFCKQKHIKKFSVLGYSLGSHYATTIVEGLPQMIDEYIVAAPSSIKRNLLTAIISTTTVGNKLFEKLMLSRKVAVNFISLFR